MINIIYGLKGNGKTAKIIEKANETAQNSKGVVVFITDRKDHSRAVSNKARFVCVNDYGITCDKCCVAFLKGLLAGNYDITDVFVDGLARFVGMEVKDMENGEISNDTGINMENIYKDIDLLSLEHNVDFTFTVSVENVPDYMKKYI